MRERLMPVQGKGEQMKEIEELIESYVILCEKGIGTCKREDLEKILQTNLHEQKCEREDKSLAKPSSPTKMAEIAEPTTTVTIISA